MDIVIADKAGYCFGIQNAMRLVNETFEKYPDDPIYCLGDISHNRQEMDRLIALGLKKIESLDEIESGVVIIRSHGEGEKVFSKAREKGLTVVNATCPFVSAMQKKVREYYQKGYQIVIIGNAAHPEVEGAMGWCDEKAIVLNTVEETENFGFYEKLCIVAQTTIIRSKFDAITEILKQKANECVIFNTICSATAERQAAAVKTANGVEYMIVIGGYHSSNTRKLYEVCKAHCEKTCHIETVRDLDLAEVRRFKKIGITAGASTPDWIVKEVTESMESNVLEQEQAQAVMNEAEEFDFASEVEKTLKSLRKGTALEGEVIDVDADEVILSIGQKSDAVIKKSDYTWKHDEELTDIVKVGDKITGIVTELNDGTGRVKMSKIKYDNQKVQIELSEAFENQTVLDGKIKSVSGSGLIVDIGFTDIFMPASQYHVRFVKNLDALVGEVVRGKIIDYNAKRRRAIFSQKVVVEAEIKERQEKQRAAKEARFNELNIDDVVTGRVKTITEFGVFIDLNGIDGFVHRSDLTWNRTNDPKSIVQKGQEIEAKVISKIKEKAKKDNPEEMVEVFQVKLSVKALTLRPWEQFTTQYNEGDELEVRITNVLEFGAFAEILPSVEGLIHVSEISYDRVESVAAVLKADDVVKVKIIGINPEKEKISLSIKATMEAPERPQRRSRKRDNGEGRERTGRSSAPRKRAAQNRNTTVYDEAANVTLGDQFANLFEGLSFSEEE